MSEYIHELSSIEKEIANLKTRLATLTEKKTQVEANIVKYMTDHSETEICVKGRTFYLEEFTKTKRQNRKVKDHTTTLLLQEYGLDSSQAKQILDHLHATEKIPHTSVTRLRQK